ncbi:tRNA dimethylallyltransferase [Gracilibacillus halotolerans]|uniref:tRNA dimethylallyltransferase n=1 Tax=Gracilibacillus halotolerans TaxID=74386 RepID=A0A841RI27_9BACI|nr:tRNA (adenosine(37)-N6)-dimethylallyltransferase MiaA [Gracilibacillus halotolerans]MBB6511517.1 tRNA dimethylallyltransferase [Gracilibacillus halotolerans]
MKEKLVVIVGPTAVGKTALSIEIAEKYNGEVISGDSMQIYRGMDIGTAKITEEEKKGIPHHLIDILSPNEDYSVAQFQKDVQAAIRSISSRGKLPILVGGTGLYIQSVLYDYQFSKQQRDEAIQEKIEQELEKYGVNHVYKRLKEVDPEQAQKIHPNNTRRLIRALEVYEQTGLTLSEYQKKQSNEMQFDAFLIGLEMDRVLLYDRINQRIDLMMEQGLLDEVEGLLNNTNENAQAMKAIGYKEFIPYFRGEQSLEETVELLKRNSRRYAKRQFTWFKNKLPVHWYSMLPTEKDNVFQNILHDLAGFLKEK